MSAIPKGIDPKVWEMTEGMPERFMIDIAAGQVWDIRHFVSEVIARAIEAEREECAKIAYVEAIKHCSARDDMRLIGHPVGFSISQAIRNLKHKTEV